MNTTTKSSKLKKVIHAPAPIEPAPVQLELELHEATSIFPELGKDVYQALKADIKANGLKVPVVRSGDRLIDGRARLRACQELEIAPRFEDVTYNNEAEVTAAVLSFNFHRRHLNDAQRALIAARLCNTQRGANQHTAGAVTQEVAARAMSVSTDSLQRVKKVLDAGNSKLIKIVEDGTLDAKNAERLAALPESVQQELLDDVLKDNFQHRFYLKAKAEREKNTNDEKAAHLAELRAKNRPIADEINLKDFNIVYADPPWDHISEKELGYTTMTLEELCAMPVNTGPDNCALFLWAPVSQVLNAGTIIKAWGFNYVTQAIWEKDGMGTGPYFRIDHEVLMFATRGSDLPSVLDGNRVSSVIRAPKGVHSKKPEAVYKIIETMYPKLPKLEMFCRGPERENWVGWGNQCEKQRKAA